MKVFFSKKQYEALIRLVFLGHNVVDGSGIENKETEAMEDVELYVYSKAKDFGIEDLIVHDNHVDQDFVNNENEDQLYKYVEAFENDLFWNSLANRLSLRDLLEQYTQEELEAMPIEERFAKICDGEARYLKEFSENGVSNLMIINKKRNEIYSRFEK